MVTKDCSLAESVTKTLPLEKVEDNKASKSKEFEVQKVDAAAEPKASDSEQTVDAKEEVAEQSLSSGQSEVPEQPVDTAEEPEPPAEAHPEPLSKSSGEKD